MISERAGEGADPVLMKSIEILRGWGHQIGRGEWGGKIEVEKKRGKKTIGYFGIGGAGEGEILLLGNCGKERGV